MVILTLLADVNTDLGKIELHHEDGSFTTVGEYTSPLDGETHVTTIPIFRESAREWWDLCERRGAIHQPFPATADSERKAS